MPIRTRLAAAVAAVLCSAPAWAQTSPDLPAIPSVMNQAQADAIIRERDAVCGPHLDQTPGLASYNRSFYCTCMGAQLSAAHTAGTAVTQPMLTKMIIDCASLAHRDTARTARPAPGGAWVEMTQGDLGRPALGWGEPNSDASLSPFGLTCQATGKLLLTVEMPQSTPGQDGKVWFSKGLHSLMVMGTIRNGANTTVVEGSFPKTNILGLLGEPDDLVMHAAGAPVRFPNATLTGPLRKFIADCRRH